MADKHHSKVTSIAAARARRAQQTRLAHPTEKMDVATLVWGATLPSDGQTRIAIESPHEAPEAHGWALTPAQARRIAAALIACADKVEGKGG